MAFERKLILVLLLIKLFYFLSAAVLNHEVKKESKKMETVESGDYGDETHFVYADSLDKYALTPSEKHPVPNIDRESSHYAYDRGLHVNTTQIRRKDKIYGSSNPWSGYGYNRKQSSPIRDLNIMNKNIRKQNRENQNIQNDNTNTEIDYNKIDSKISARSQNFQDRMEERRITSVEIKNGSNSNDEIDGSFCDFEKPCSWVWNLKDTEGGTSGFQRRSPVELKRANQSTGYKISSPDDDADGNPEGHFLYLPIGPTTGVMAIKSPVFYNLLESCKIEVFTHLYRMENGSYKFIAEPVTKGAPAWVLGEHVGNVFERWHKISVTVGRVQQEFSLVIEVVPGYIAPNLPFQPHFSVDNIRMVQCHHKKPVIRDCPGHLKCPVNKVLSCISPNRICDILVDCDDESDERQNCEKIPPGGRCSFEDNWCGWSNGEGNNAKMKWTRHNGPTPTEDTGPDRDHTCSLPDRSPPIDALFPLLPERMNGSNPSCVGHYLYVNMAQHGYEPDSVSFASNGFLDSTIFNPPPSVHGNESSRYYNSCTIRFYHHQYGMNSGSLSLSLIQLGPLENYTKPLWWSSKNRGKDWIRSVVVLPNVTRRYMLQFETRMGMRIYSDVAIDDFSLAPECFGLNIPSEELGDYNYYDPIHNKTTDPHDDFLNQTYYHLTTCGAKGRTGPNQTMCNTEYSNTSVSVSVGSEIPFVGIQSWLVPAEGYYTIIASGAGGGLGSARLGTTRGSRARGLFELHKGEVVYALVGQQGTHACMKSLSLQTDPTCSRPSENITGKYRSKAHQIMNTEVQDGGGGGGGATYVFLIDRSGKRVPLLVAGGGGGLSVGRYVDDGVQHGRTLTNKKPLPGHMYGKPGETAGAGGGWLPEPGPATAGHELVRGRSLTEGGEGGGACSEAGGPSAGGFGGGGGGCTKGGGGGGWAGGETSLENTTNGAGGYSYVDSSRSVRLFSSVVPAAHVGPGEVFIVPAIHACGCDYRCVALDVFRSNTKCFCPDSWISDRDDPVKCVLPYDWTKLHWAVLAAFGLGAVIFVATVVVCSFWLYTTYQRKRERDMCNKSAAEHAIQLRALRPGSDAAVLDNFNPHYGCEGVFAGGIDVRQLPQVDRDDLKLIKPLGQGAFGEVYQGIYRRSRNTEELPVAVKTLPEMSTLQSEQDFLMEAAIMAKFNHPNIVHLIGICFDRHPRFIVLELLGGGDLKAFLRENRPKVNRCSILSMKDLLLCSLDIAKGCKYMEAKRFIHRDIAARNCLLSSRGPGRVVKIADFGMARDIYRSDYYRKGRNTMIPIKWMPPEAFLDGIFTAKSDVWSFGILLWEVFSMGVMPYPGCGNQEVMQLVTTGGRLDTPYGCPQEIYNIMCLCWNPNAEERPSFVYLYEQLSFCLQEPDIVGAQLPLFAKPSEVNNSGSYLTSSWRLSATDYLIPKQPGCGDTEPLDEDNEPLSSPDDSQVVPSSSTDTLLPDALNKTSKRSRPSPEGSTYPTLCKASPEYGNIQITGEYRTLGDGGNTATRDVASKMIFQQSKSTDRLLGTTNSSEDLDVESDETQSPQEPVWKKPNKQSPQKVETTPDGPLVDKLISIDTPQQTPTTTAAPTDVLTQNTNTTANHKDKKFNLAVDMKAKMAPIASPDPPRITPNINRTIDYQIPPKNQKPLCLDAAQLEQNLNALKRNSGSVNLKTMNMNLPSYINVVTPNKLSESKTIQIDPKKAVIHDLNSPPKENEEINVIFDKEKESITIKQSGSTNSLLNGPLTEVPYADSTGSSSSTSHSVGLSDTKKLHVIERSSSYAEIDLKKGKSKVKRKKSNESEYLNSQGEIQC